LRQAIVKEERGAHFAKKKKEKTKKKKNTKNKAKASQRVIVFREQSVEICND
jgi:hypothetical protein